VQKIQGVILAKTGSYSLKKITVYYRGKNKY